MRIYIIGNSAQGKTTIGKELSRQTGIVSYDMDDLFWLPNWQQIRDEEKIEVLNNIAKKDSWIVSGNYSKVSGVIKENATCIIWLYYPYHMNMWRSIKRSINRAWTKKEVCNGNVESWRNLFTKDSIILWAHQCYKKNEEKGKKWQQEMPEKMWFVIRKKKDLDEVFETLKKIEMQNKR